MRLAEATEREVESAMRDFIRFVLERDARSLAFLDEIRTPEAAVIHARHDAALAAAAATEPADPETIGGRA